MPTEPRATHAGGPPSPRWMLLSLGAALLALLLAAPTGARAEDAKGDETKKEGEKKDKDGDVSKTDDKGEGKAEAGAKGRPPLLPVIKANERDFKELVEAAREYFNLDEEQWKGRTALVKELETQAQAGHWFLKDMDALRWLVMQSRSFNPPLTDRKWQRANGISDAKSAGGTLYRIKAEGLDITFSVPRDYPKAKDLEKKYPRTDPLPLLVSMHEKADFAAKVPGAALLKRRYEDKKLWEPLYKEWLMLMPQAPAAAFVSKSGQPRAEVFQQPLSVFWKHYHIDFDRVILDGTEDAFTMAGSMPIFWAGIVFRGKWKLDDAKKAQVKNFAPVPVFVVDNPELADELTAAGHPNVTKGIANATLMKWMSERRREAPKSFAWNAARTDQVLPYWINLDSPNWSAPKREIQVEVVDTETEPNTIKIDAVGIDVLSMFLNDDVVDLDKNVRVVVNGHLEHDAKLEVQDKRLETLGRDFDFLFNREPLRIRNSMYFGWLTPSRIVQIAVRKPAPKKPAEDEKKDEPKATPQQEIKAERLFTKAQDYVKNGLNEEACRVLDRILEMPRNNYTDRAKELKDKVEGKAGK